MTGLDNVKTYLVEKVAKINLNNSKANTGGALLKASDEWEKESINFVYEAMSTIQGYFTRDTKESPAGTAKLTALATSIGTIIGYHISEEGLQWSNQVRLGDLFLEAFLNCGFLDIYRDPGFAATAKEAPYIVQATRKWSELAEIPESMGVDVIRATTHEIIPDIKGLMQNQRPLIKGWDHTYVDVFKNFLDKPFVKSINNLQQTAWKINHEVHTAVSADTDRFLFEVPIMPTNGSKLSVNEAYTALKADDTTFNRKKYNREVERWNKKLAVLKASSKNREFSIIMDKSRMLAGWACFYQYVDADYRGRIYYQEPFLNYQGNDLARGLISFARGKVLTEEGLQSLKIHAANSYNESFSIDEIPEWCEYDYKRHLEDSNLESISVDKMTLEDRITWADVNINLMINWAYRKEIQNCEKPVVFYACCVEFKNHNEAQLKGETYYSSIPVPIDGSCNGYQHSAAISRDELTGELVSLTNQDLQDDLYVKVAQELVAMDPEWFESRDMPVKAIRKGISKRATMTRAYSAGAAKIADSMYTDLYTEGMTKQYDIDMLDCENLSKMIIVAINNVCPGAQKTMKFLQDCANYELGTHVTKDVHGTIISKTKIKKLKTRQKKLRRDLSNEATLELNEVTKTLNSYKTVLIDGNGSTELQWMSASGFPVRYEAWIQKSVGCLSTISGLKGGATAQPGRVQHVANVPTTIPNRQKFMAGVSPNWIHSADASHMALTIANWTGDFGAIHDSFSCHASDIDKLKILTREVFWSMYASDNPLEDIKESIISEGDIDTPELGNLEIDEVLESRYFFC